MDELVTAAVVCFLAMIAVGLIGAGLAMLFMHTWPYLLAGASITGVGFIIYHVEKRRRASEAYLRARIDAARVRAEKDVEVAFNDTILAMRDLTQGR